jgi:hypothetical protein
MGRPVKQYKRPPGMRLDAWNPIACRPKPYTCPDTGVKLAPYELSDIDLMGVGTLATKKL